jgi:Fe-S cluster assembly protein SufB
MVEKKSDKLNNIVEEIIEDPYIYGFVTDIETENFPKGINNQIINSISNKKEEPSFLNSFRQKAYRI